MAYVFGKAITYEFYPLDEEGLRIDMSAVTDAPTIYVFTSKPTRTAAIAGTGAAQTVSSWSNTSSNNGKTFTITAISDPDPTSETERYTYWVAINGKLVNSGQSQCWLRALPIRRADAQSGIVSSSQGDLEAVFDNIDSFATSGEQTAAINLAETETKIALEAANYEWARIWEPNDLNQAVTYKALAIILMSKIQEPNDKWHTLSAHYDRIAETIRRNVNLRYDETNAKEPTTKQTEHHYARIIR